MARLLNRGCCSTRGILVEPNRRPVIVGHLESTSLVHSNRYIPRVHRADEAQTHASSSATLPGECMSFLSWESAVCYYASRSTQKGHSMFHQSEKSLVIPLLCPEKGVPFTTCIELHGIQGLEGQIPVAMNEANNEKKGFSDVYELRFVLHGSGEMKRHSDGGDVERVSPGDAILCKCGSVSYSSSVMSDGYRSRSGVSWGMATFVVYIPKALVHDNDTAFEHAFSACRDFMANCTWPKSNVIPVTDVLSSEDVDVLLRGAQTLGTNSRGHHVDTRTSPVSPLHKLLSTIRRMLMDPHGDNFPTLKKKLTDVSTFLLPNQTNRLALLFDPFANTPIPFVFGVEIFEPGHKTKPHVHSKAFEMFFILQGTGEGFCQGSRFPIRPGDVVAFQPGSTHGIDNGPDERMYCIEVMLPDENFAEFVRSGPLNKLEEDDLCILTRVGCS